MRLMLIQASPRHKHNCPHEWAKTTLAVKHVHDNPQGGVEFDVLDLSVGPEAVPIQPCKGCVSTAGGYHCHGPECDCYGSESAEPDTPDLMHSSHVYDRLLAADGFVVFTPVHWYSVPTRLKAMFDRMVCLNQTLTVDNAKRLLGPEPRDRKDPAKTKALARSGKAAPLLRNHLEGRVAGFFCHGDGGGDDYATTLPPASYRNRAAEPSAADAIAPLVWQCRYSGVEVPDSLVEAFDINQGVGAWEQNSRTEQSSQFVERARLLVDRVVNHIRVRGG